jgi:hypothetical protein
MPRHFTDKIWLFFLVPDDDTFLALGTATKTGEQIDKACFATGSLPAFATGQHDLNLLEQGRLDDRWIEFQFGSILDALTIHTLTGLHIPYDLTIFE